MSVEEYVKLELPIRFEDSIMAADVSADYFSLIKWDTVAEMILSHIPPTHDVTKAVVLHSEIHAGWREADLVALIVAMLAGREVRVVSTVPSVNGASSDGRSKYGNIRWKSAANLSSAVDSIGGVDLIVVLEGKILDSAGVGLVSECLKKNPKCVAVILQPATGVVPMRKMLEARGLRLAKRTDSVMLQSYPRAVIDGVALGVVSCIGSSVSGEV